MSMPAWEPQLELIEFLQSEAYHSLGCYGIVVERLTAQSRRARPASDAAPTGVTFTPSMTPPLPAEVLAAMADYNRNLRDFRHRPARDTGAPGADGATWLAASRHPRPKSDLMCALYGLDASAYTPFERVKPKADAHRWITDFYATAIAALDTPPISQALICLGDSLRAHHQRSGPHPKGLRRRLEVRQQRAREVLGADAIDRADPPSEIARRIVEDDLAQRGGGSLHDYVFRVLVDAHLRLHVVEHMRWTSFGWRRKDRGGHRKDIEEELATTLVLNSFVYDVCLFVPWIFARDPAERELVARSVVDAHRNLAPPLCMWAATQMLLLALFRRAFAHALEGDPERAHNDYHKLQTHIRDATRGVRSSATRPRGAEPFLEALEALAQYQVGELYRAHHAHGCALRHFNRALRRMEQMVEREDEELRHVLDNASWHVTLIVSMGKARYEMGSPRRALALYLRAWRRLLVLQATKKVFDRSTGELDAAIAWLHAHEDDPDIDKQEAITRLAPCLQEITATWVAHELRALAAEVLLRLGHVLLVMRIGDARRTPPKSPRPADLHELAYGCLRMAAQHDPSVTLVWTDLLRVALDRGSPADDSAMPPIMQQWPLGGDFQQAIRVIEFEILRALQASPPNGESPDAHVVARNLLADFMRHTDSTNVKASQTDQLVHRRREPSDPELSRPCLEFVCLRRYSCSFLPRPASFRPLGGGYLVRVHRPQEKHAFGIAIDPGPDFLDTLYRCQHGLNDIDAIIVTHEHADHIASLYGMLKLFDRRDSERPVIVLANKSVAQRYQDADAPATFHELLGRKPLPELPVSLQCAPNKGHTDLHRAPALRIVIGLHDGHGSIAFTSDYAFSDGVPRDMLQADVVVAHMGGTPGGEPARELRRLAGIEARTRAAVNEYWDRIDPEDQKRLTQVGLGRDAVAGTTRPRAPMLEGLVELARAMKARARGRSQLLVVGELAEELGTFRSKVARRINEHVLKDSKCAAITADVGLRVVIGRPARHPEVRVLCSVCALDNDRTLPERFHPIKDMREVCVRGENEGMFYNCTVHDPRASGRFVERVDRYDIFGR